MPVLYKSDLSPPSRSIMMMCEIFGVPVDMKEINVLEMEHHSPEFLQKNPLHAVPVFEDGNLIIHDSHAIMIYLADAYGKNDSMYPKDIKQRALINQILFFNASILFSRLRNVTYPVVMEGQRKVAEKLLKDIDEAYGFVEEFLSRNKFLAGDRLTIADVAAFSTVMALHVVVQSDVKKYHKLQTWIKELEKQPYCKKYNAPGLEKSRDIFKKLCDL